MQVWLLILTFAGVDFEGGQYQERAWCVRAAQYQTALQKPLRMRWRCELRTLQEGLMLWSPTGPTVTTTLSPGAAQPFVPPTSLNLGGVARVFGGAALSTFTLGGSTVTNTLLIPLGIGQDIVIAYGPTDTHIIASAADVRITPGIARP